MLSEGNYIGKTKSVGLFSLQHCQSVALNDVNQLTVVVNSIKEQNEFQSGRGGQCGEPDCIGGYPTRVNAFFRVSDNIN